MGAVTMYILTILLVYMFIGPSLILLNKFILHNLNFPYPMFLSGLGVAVSGLAAQIIVRSGYVVLQRKETVEGSLWYRRVLPVGLAHAGEIAFPIKHSFRAISHRDIVNLLIITLVIDHITSKHQRDR